MISLLYRAYTAFNPPTPEKKKDAIRFGILGAAQTASLSLVLPAKSHPEVILQAVAARDRCKAEEFAKKHGIPEVKSTYQDVLDDPNIQAVYIPLANSLHFEWSVRAIRAGKHVLLEKPSVANAVEAKILFTLPELSQTNAPVLLEASHNRFHPALRLFLSFINPEDVVNVHTNCMVPYLMTPNDSIGLNYDLAGGSMMHMGTYCFAMLRMIFRGEPEECLACDPQTLNEGDKCDYAFKAQFRFPNGGIGEAAATLRGSLLWKPSEARVTMREVVFSDPDLPPTQEKVCSRQVTMHGFMNAVLWHRIDVIDSFLIRDKSNRQPIKKWVESKSYKAYTNQEVGDELADLPGEDWWMSFRHQLEAFVNQVKGRSTQYWIPGEDSIKQMKMIDMAYGKSGLGRRMTSSFGSL